MLSPDQRAVAMELLRPPAGYRIDEIVLMSYSLDLDVLLSLPLAVLAHSDRGVDELLEDPMLVIEALREAGERLHVFVDEGGIAVPHANRALYTLLETCVHPVRAPGGGAFHPKVWLVRFVDVEQQPLIRVAVSSRNLTFDRSWDVALTSEAAPEGRRMKESRSLAELVRAVPGMVVRGIKPDVADVLARLADEVERVRFPAPAGFADAVSFEIMGLTGKVQAPWRPAQSGPALLAMAPFVSRTGLDALAACGTDERILISRPEELDEIAEEALAAWQQVLVLSEAALDEPDDAGSRPADLHVKLMAVEHGRQVTWHVGSANLTAAALTGRNVEVLASVTGPRGNRGSGKGFGIQRFQESGFLNLCEPYRRTERPPEDEALKAGKRALEQAQDALLRSELRVKCRAQGDDWRWSLEGQVDVPAEVSASCWPVTLTNDNARPLDMPCQWALPIARLTAFVAFRLTVDADVDDLRLVLKLPVDGMPEGRIAHVLRTLIDSPEKFLKFLRALLGGLDGMADWASDQGTGAWQGEWAAGLGGETLLEDLVRAAAREPERLEPVRRLIKDLRATPEGRKIVPDDLYDLWRVIDDTLSAGPQS
ncbi:MAG: phospholipase D family protein [Wenzhouxiangella sp.]|nr:phospholipase D family protein [Wenzhouxiangella sp.]MCH8478440.1 phospholipase D family protein [Wenzhouxiangella sp.]TVR97396.1 MAG: hypothetical protein EA418_03175 [Wenzhouxiangellaceae bacterium]